VARVAPERFDTANLDRATAEVLAALASADVDVLLLKGPALAALLYTAGEHRSYSDVDLLVAPIELDAAEEVLLALGYTNADGVTGVDDVGGVVHAHTWVRNAATGPTMIDLHRWLSGAEAPPHVAWVALLAHRTWIEVAGRRAAVLDPAGQGMHLALHAAQHGAAYERQLDELALALERWPAEVWDSAAALAAEIEATRAFAAGLRLLSRGAAEAARLGLPVTAEEDWTIRHRAARPRGTFHIRALAEAGSVSDRLRILRRALLPNREWIVHQHPAAQHSTARLIGAYAVHLARAPAWAARAWLFRQKAKRAAQRR
jgi:hypothetical protein